MSGLRDARFEKALAHAPDADVRATDATRAAIRAAALRAVAPPQGAPWWSRIFSGTPAGMPWNAAFASMLIAGVVTLLWRGGEEVPQEVAMTSPQPVAAPQAQPAPAPAAAPIAVPPPAPATVQKAAPKPTVPPSPSPSPSASPPPPQAAQPQTEREKRAVLADAAAPSAAGTAVQAESRAAAAPPLAAAAPAIAPAPAPAPAPAGAMRRAESAAPAAAPAPRAAWDSVRIEAAQREAVLPRAQAATLAAAIDELLAARGAPAPASPALVQLTLADNTRTAGQLTLGEDTVTWQPTGEPARTWRPDPTRLANLRAQALQSLQR